MKKCVKKERKIREVQERILTGLAVIFSDEKRIEKERAFYAGYRFSQVRKINNKKTYLRKNKINRYSGRKILTSEKNTGSSRLLKFAGEKNRYLITRR